MYNNNLCSTLLSEITLICMIHRANHKIKFMTAFFCNYVSNEDKLWTNLEKTLCFANFKSEWK